MNLLLSLLLTAVAQVPQAPLPGLGGAPGAAPQQQETVLKVMALVASGEGQAAQQIPAELQEMKALLKELPFGHFRLESQAQEPISIDTLTTLPLSADYNLELLPEEQTEDNQYLVNLKISTADGIAALAARAKIPIQKPVVVRGLDAADGELIVVLALTQEGGGQGENEEQDEGQEDEQDEQEDQQDQQQPQEQEEAEQGEQDQQEAQEQDQQQQQQQQSEQQQDAQEQPPEDQKPENIEAILQHLEQMDRREQRSLIQQRDVRKIPGEWW